MHWQKHGLEEPEAVKRASLEYRETEDVFKAFVRECELVFDLQLEISASELVELLNDWCKEEGRKTPKGMSDWLEENGCKTKQRRVTGMDGKETRPRYWEGIGVQETAEDQLRCSEYGQDEREGLQQY